MLRGRSAPLPPLPIRWMMSTRGERRLGGLWEKAPLPMPRSFRKSVCMSMYIYIYVCVRVRVSVFTGLRVPCHIDRERKEEPKPNADRGG